MTAKEISEFFGRYAIGQTSTPLANQYLVLRLDFSRINTESRSSTFTGFLENVKQGVSRFLSAYGEYYTDASAAYIFAAEELNLDYGTLPDRRHRTQESALLATAAPFFEI